MIFTILHTTNPLANQETQTRNFSCCYNDELLNNIKILAEIYQQNSGNFMVNGNMQKTSSKITLMNKNLVNSLKSFNSDENNNPLKYINSNIIKPIDFFNSLEDLLKQISEKKINMPQQDQIFIQKIQNSLNELATLLIAIKVVYPKRPDKYSDVKLQDLQEIKLKKGFSEIKLRDLNKLINNLFANDNVEKSPNKNLKMENTKKIFEFLKKYLSRLDTTNDTTIPTSMKFRFTTEINRILSKYLIDIYKVLGVELIDDQSYKTSSLFNKIIFYSKNNEDVKLLKSLLSAPKSFKDSEILQKVKEEVKNKFKNLWETSEQTFDKKNKKDSSKRVIFAQQFLLLNDLCKLSNSRYTIESLVESLDNNIEQFNTIVDSILVETTNVNSLYNLYANIIQTDENNKMEIYNNIEKLIETNGLDLKDQSTYENIKKFFEYSKNNCDIIDNHLNVLMKKIEERKQKQYNNTENTQKLVQKNIDKTEDKTIKEFQKINQEKNEIKKALEENKNEIKKLKTQANAIEKQNQEIKINKPNTANGTIAGGLLGSAGGVVAAIAYKNNTTENGGENDNTPNIPKAPELPANNKFKGDK